MYAIVCLALLHTPSLQVFFTYVLWICPGCHRLSRTLSLILGFLVRPFDGKRSILLLDLRTLQNLRLCVTDALLRRWFLYLGFRFLYMLSLSSL